MIQKKKRKYGPTPKEFKPNHPEKYTGKTPIISRSSYETKAMFSMDNNPSIISWDSESLVIPYFDSVKQKNRRYFLDLTFKIKDTNGKVQTYVCEIKPESQTHMPKRGRKKEKTYLNECATFATNIAKWKAAKKYCDNKGHRFILWTENGLRVYNYDKL